MSSQEFQFPPHSKAEVLTKKSLNYLQELSLLLKYISDIYNTNQIDIWLFDVEEMKENMKTFAYFPPALWVFCPLSIKTQF